VNQKSTVRLATEEAKKKWVAEGWRAKWEAKKKAEEKEKKKKQEKGKEEKSCSRQRSGCVKRKRGTLGNKNRKNGCALRLGRRRGYGRRKRIAQRRLNGYAKPSRKCRRLWKKLSSSILSSISLTETRDCIGELSQSFPPSVLILTSSGLMN
jgi:hypothetical protein